MARRWKYRANNQRQKNIQVDNMPTSKFLQLPRELRDQIYDLILPQQVALPSFSRDYHPSKDFYDKHGYLLANHQIRTEILDVLYESRTFAVCTGEWGFWELLPTTRQRKGIRHIRLGDCHRSIDDKNRHPLFGAPRTVEVFLKSSSEALEVALQIACYVSYPFLHYWLIFFGERFTSASKDFKALRSVATEVTPGYADDIAARFNRGCESFTKGKRWTAQWIKREGSETVLILTLR